MSNNKVLDTALSIIDKNIWLDHKEIVRRIYAETGYCDHDFNKFFAIISSGSLTLRDYIRKRRLYFAVCDMMNCPEKSLTDIALNYGYSEQSAFTRAIKGEYKKAPAELRKSNQVIPDNRKAIELYLFKKSRLDSVIEKITSNEAFICHDNGYFDAFIQATEEYGFDVSTCCIISELSEKLDIPFAALIDRCFDMMIDYHSDPNYVPSRIDYAMDLGIASDTELDSMCEYYKCEYYELTEWNVREYRKKHEQES